jgi:hypothetical protein
LTEVWITTAEALKFSGYPIEHIRRLLRNGHIKTRKWGIEWMVEGTYLGAYSFFPRDVRFDIVDLKTEKIILSPPFRVEEAKWGTK